MSCATSTDTDGNNSHWHFDHLGDASIFPPTTELVVGPGFTAAQIPGYPTNPTANVLESDFA